MSFILNKKFREELRSYQIIEFNEKYDALIVPGKRGNEPGDKNSFYWYFLLISFSESNESWILIHSQVFFSRVCVSAFRWRCKF